MYEVSREWTGDQHLQGCEGAGLGRGDVDLQCSCNRGFNQRPQETLELGDPVELSPVDTEESEQLFLPELQSLVVQW